MCLQFHRVWISLSQQCVWEGLALLHSSASLFCFPGNYRNCLLYMENLQVFSALENNTISNPFSLESNSSQCGGLHTIDSSQEELSHGPSLRWKSPQMSKDQNGNCKQNRDVWEQCSRVAALVLPTPLWCRAWHKFLLENLGSPSAPQHKYNLGQVRQKP